VQRRSAPESVRIEPEMAVRIYSEMRVRFRRNPHLTSVTIGSGLTSLGKDVFGDCTGLSTIVVDPENPAYSSLEGLLLNKDRTTLVQCPRGRAGSLAIPDGITSIGDWAFASCVKLTSVIMGNSVSSIGDCAFIGCTRLTRLTLPNRVTRIGDMAFANCSRLTGAYFEGDVVTMTVGSSPFEGCSVVIAYYRPGATGWGTTFAGRPTALWVPPPSYPEWIKATALPTQYPELSGETDDPDADGMINFDEMLAGTDPADHTSVLVLEYVARPNDLTEEDRIPIGESQHALYLRTVPGKSYGIQVLGWTGWQPQPWWWTVAVVTATTPQKRLVFEKPVPYGFYRVMLAQ